VETRIIVTGLQAGMTYTFYVNARNLVEYSVNSDIISVLAAQIADAPTGLADVAAVTRAN
jgi:hypothetical protein